jgi:hypothetical protein
VSTDSAEVALKSLTARGFRTIPMLDSEEMPPIVLFIFAWDEPFIDAVILRGEDDAAAYRSKDVGLGEVNLFAPKNVVWFHEGATAEVVDELFKIPQPGERGAPMLVIPTPSSLWLPPSTRKTGRAGLGRP